MFGVACLKITIPKNKMIPKLYIARVPTMCHPKSIEKKRACHSSWAPINTSIKSRLLMFATPYFSEVLRGPSPLSAETPMNPELSLSTMNLRFGLLTSNGLEFGTSGSHISRILENLHHQAHSLCFRKYFQRYP